MTVSFDRHSICLSQLSSDNSQQPPANDILLFCVLKQITCERINAHYFRLLNIYYVSHHHHHQRHHSWHIDKDKNDDVGCTLLSYDKRCRVRVVIIMRLMWIKERKIIKEIECYTAVGAPIYRSNNISHYKLFLINLRDGPWRWNECCTHETCTKVNSISTKHTHSLARRMHRIDANQFACCCVLHHLRAINLRQATDHGDVTCFSVVLWLMMTDDDTNAMFIATVSLAFR